MDDTNFQLEPSRPATPAHPPLAMSDAASQQGLSDEEADGLASPAENGAAAHQDSAEEEGLDDVDDLFGDEEDEEPA